MPRKEHTEGDAKGGDEGPVAESAAPMERFKKLTARLLKVKREDLGKRDGAGPPDV
ncbi:MAG TPA: hypothetical protein VGG29_19080 [Caulobacteraceae bacterium]|jgi:hypothetical protein